MKNTRRIGIIGVGFVGKVLWRYFKSKKYPVAVYDKFRSLGTLAGVNKAGVIFICTPTPYIKGKGYDLSSVWETADLLKGSKIIVVKSTVYPGTTDSLQKKYPQHMFLFNPEFLREKFAYSDLTGPDRQILGVTKKSDAAAKEIFKILPKAPYKAIVPAASAEMAKFMGNSFLALKVVFANEMFDLCKKIGVDYEITKLICGNDLRIGRSHFNVNEDNYRGYGGSCLPKDVNGLLNLAKKNKVNFRVLNAARSKNRELLKLSGFSEEYFLAGLHRRKIKKL